MGKRQEYRATAHVDGAIVGTAITYAHNSALHAAKDILRPLANGGFWEHVSVAKNTEQTVVSYVHTDGRAATVTVYRPEGN